jgi:general secretion pathway protein B
MAAASTQKIEPSTIPVLGDLAEDLRRQLPKMTITGAVYSKNPAQRVLLINNQVLTQGSTVAPDLTLEDIQPHQSVFDFRGTRFRVAH